MARELTDINTTGELADIKLGGAGAEKSVSTKEYVDAADALKADAADLTNVDNTSDADKPISDSTQAALNRKLEDTGNDVIGFDPQNPRPTRVEGLLFYDEETRSFSMYPDVDMTLNLGQEEVIRVWNATGATIPNATPVTLVGAVGGLPSVAVAQANTSETAVVPGITTHEIPDGTAGFITHAGTLGGDFSAFVIGDRLYLSDVTPGGMIGEQPGAIDLVPDLATTLGTVLDNDAVDGKIQVRISSLVSIPTVIAYMNEALDPPGGTIGTTYQNVDNFQDFGSVVMTSVPAAGTITVTTDGIYRVSFNLSMTFASSASARIFSLQLWDVTDGVSVFTIPTSITKDVANYDATVSAPFTAAAGHQYVFRVASSTILASVSYNFTSFDMTSIHIR